MARVVGTSTGGREAVRFFVIGVKRAEGDGQTEAWTEAREQLNDSIGQILERHPCQASEHVYEAIAVGRYVKFYLWNCNTEQMNPLYTTNDDYYHIKRQCRTIQMHLDYIKAHN